MKLNQYNICACCIRVDKGHFTYLFGAVNNMQPGLAPNLPILTQTEEMLIARVHVFVEVRRIRDQQYKYRGHVVNFPRDTGRVYNQLPLLASDLEIIVLRPSNASNSPGTRHQFIHDQRVRRSAIVSWLQFLRENHSGYANIEILQQAIMHLPVDGDVELSIEEIGPIDIPEETQKTLIDPSTESAAVPGSLARDSRTMVPSKVSGIQKRNFVQEIQHHRRMEPL